MSSWSDIARAIDDVTHVRFTVARATPVAGGCINQAYRLEDDAGQSFFVKLNQASCLPMFAAESTGLKAIAASHSLRVPQPVVHGVSGQQSFLVLEYLELHSAGSAKRLGTQLAAMHRNTAAHFGWTQDNFIGSTPQPNAWATDWITFWRERRLGFHLRLAAEKGLGGSLQRLGAQLQAVLPAFFEGYTPAPSLLHGDLWSGNLAFLPDGTPVIFDSAPYYGDRECDIAMTELFGGFPQEFYSAYHEHYPPHPGYAKRRDLYNLYHLLNHANLFGGSYTRQAEQGIKELLSRT